MTLAAQCEASSFSVPCGAATVMERGSIEFFNNLLGGPSRRPAPSGQWHNAK
jgi:hypothetical protein